MQTEQMTKTTCTSRRFDAAIPVFTKARRHIPESEDREPTVYLLRALREVRSKCEVPVACPHCGSRDTALAGRAHARMPRPSFLYQSCGKKFNRLTSTPLARLRHERKALEFVRLLSQQLSYAQAAERLDVDYTAIVNWCAKFRLWLLELDPGGHWESRVRRGLKPKLVGNCPRCCFPTMRLHGFDSSSGERRVRCASCKSVSALRTMPNAGIQLVTAYDPAIEFGRLIPVEHTRLRPEDAQKHGDVVRATAAGPPIARPEKAGPV